MAFNGNTSPALSEAQVEQLFELRRRRAALTAEINRILGSVAQVDRPSWHCERCGHTWKGMWRNRKPRHCSKCHAANWDRPSPKNNGASPHRLQGWLDSINGGLTPPPPPLPIPDVAPFATRFSETVMPPQPERTGGSHVETMVDVSPVRAEESLREMSSDQESPIVEQIEATQERARDVAIETLMQEPQPCTAHRFIDGVCLFCGDPEPPSVNGEVQ